MELRNRQGVAVDPVPFLVVVASVLVVVYSFGPIYLVELDVPLPSALGVCTVVCLCLVTVAYYRLVWTARPEHRGVVPVERRIKRLFYAVLAGIALLGLLALPLLA